MVCTRYCGEWQAAGVGRRMNPPYYAGDKPALGGLRATHPLTRQGITAH